MPEMAFDYRTVRGEPYLVPLVEVLLYGPTATVVVPAVVDSGAVRPFFPRSAADEAGIVLPTKPNDRVQYGVGQSAVWRADASVSLGTERWRTEISFADRLDLPYALLGRRGVFARFNEVVFVEKVRSPKVIFRW